MTSTHRIFITADGSEAVHADDPRAAFLLVGRGCAIDEAEARRLGLVGDDGAFLAPPRPGETPEGGPDDVAPKPKRPRSRKAD